jgi:hypothetical protein
LGKDVDLQGVYLLVCLSSLRLRDDVRGARHAVESVVISYQPIVTVGYTRLCFA